MSTERVVKFTQELLLEDDPQTISPALIGERIDEVLLGLPRYRDTYDRDAAITELVRRFSLWIGSDRTIESGAGHVAWLDSDRKGDWRYWKRYAEHQEGKMAWSVVDALDRSTDSVLGMLEDPAREGPWDRRGLVVGHVQSGKTGHYTGLICKAADAGYKIIIVLAGLHNNLRSQTQMRLDEGFLGYETHPDRNDIRAIGVGLIDNDPALRPNYVTNRTDRGDFNSAKARSLGISPEQRPWLFVVKKNKTVLNQLLRWIQDHVADAQEKGTGRKIVTGLPLLLIDDEADHASVDTGEQIFDEDGRPDEDHEPTAINRAVRRILHTFDRSAYVGYTATPFANIFIHERGETREEGPDLFPTSFIVNLAAPSSYVGPAQVFGLQAAGGRTRGLPLFRAVRDHQSDDGKSGWMPQGHKNGYVPSGEGAEGIPDSLRDAIDSFFLAVAVRKLRGQGDDHASMLVHVTRFTSVQKAVHEQIDAYVGRLRQRLARRIGAEDAIDRLRRLWDGDFLPTNAAARSDFRSFGEAEPLPEFVDVLAALPDVMADTSVRMINGTAKDALDYGDQSGRGLKVIAIGGDKLSRGLTLEGLCTSYFLRASKMYDTLMQMGRWFGYRPGYVDLCRLYTTDELGDWFGHIADAAEELREEFDLMAASGATPREYGLKVQSHPVLMVTSRLKMRSARSLMLSFSGQVVETVSLFTDPGVLQTNLDATKRLIAGLGAGETDPVRQRPGTRQGWKGRVWTDVPAQPVIDFLHGYKTHRDAYKVNSTLLAEFVAEMNRDGELTSWTVALIGGGKGATVTLAPGLDVDMLLRTANDGTADRYGIGRLLSPRDEAIDLDADAWQAALDLTRRGWQADAARLKTREEPSDPSGPAIRRIRGEGSDTVAGDPRRGLLLLYMLDPALARQDMAGLPPVVAFGISFPASGSGVKVKYEVNNVAWEQDYGGAD
ncbi:Z1 domain-containing protein [Brevundimonas sp.]|uniref:Z1 domain-containing protein n=1 Tax=Brevundimonas sp. TaxID=1871086 RepID=UPI0035B1B64C